TNTDQADKIDIHPQDQLVKSETKVIDVTMG
ncbi:PTS glucose transporter subunit IIA, partial [Staphylococcus nepalensis]